MDSDDELPPALIIAEDDVPVQSEQNTPPLPSVDDRENKIPITLLTGYLGAGKSTLLQYILTANHGYRIAVCMNDFGDSTDIESQSLTLSGPSSAPDTQFLSLPNGCLCCSIKEPGIQAIENMVAQMQAGEGGKVDWVVVELTGVADPVEIAKSFWTNEELGGLLKLDSVVCVVDSRNIQDQLKEDIGDSGVNECQRQIACSDVILLNKTDLITPSSLEVIKSTIQDLNPTAPLIPTLRSAINLSHIFRISAFSGTTLPVLPSPSHDHPHTHAHQSSISAINIPLPPLSALQLGRLEKLLQSVLWDSQLPQGETPEGFQVLRAKGLFRVEGGGVWVLQGVRDLYEMKEVVGKAREGGEEEEVGGKLVFIGRGLGGVDWEGVVGRFVGFREG